jgi:hypothetical protein
VPETEPAVLTIADMPPNSFDSLMRSLAKAHWAAVAASPKTIITDAATLAHLFRLVSSPPAHYRAPFWLNLQAVGPVLFMRSADPSADKTPRHRAAERAVLGSRAAVARCCCCPLSTGVYKRVVRYRMADLMLVVKDACLAVAGSPDAERENDDDQEEQEPEEQQQQQQQEEEEGVVPVCGEVRYAYESALEDTHFAGVMPLMEHRLGGDQETEREVQHVRVIGASFLSRCDGGFYFSRADKVQNFCPHTDWDGGLVVGGPMERKPKNVDAWEAEHADVLRALAHLLDRTREIVCRETERNPEAKFAGYWRTGLAMFKIWYAAPEVDGGVIQFSRCPYLLSEDIRRMLEGLF